MSRFSIRLFPDPVLRKPAETVRVFDRELQDMIREMDKAMRAQPHGIGIAAPQVGICRKIALVDVSARVVGADRLVLINPVILAFEEETASREGCMSLPDYTGLLKRYKRIKTRWQDETGRFHEKESDGIEAICIQHEVDHLSGMLFMDRIVSLKRDLIPRGLKKPKG